MIVSILTNSAPDLQAIKSNLPIIETKIVIEKLSVKDLVSYTSDLYKISNEIPLAIVDAESDYRNVCNKEKGCVSGIGPFQITQETFDEQCKNTPLIYDDKRISKSPFDIIDNVDCGVRMIKNEEYFRWKPSIESWLPMLSEENQNKINALCSCVKGLRSFGVNMPFADAKNIRPNSVAKVGNVILFKYLKTYHASLIIEIHEDYYLVKETNSFRCQYGERKILKTDPYIRGFYKPKTI